MQEIKTVWADALGGFTAEHLKYGINRCLSEQTPPNLPQFIEYCRNAMRVSVNNNNTLENVLPDSVCRQRIKELRERLSA